MEDTDTSTSAMAVSLLLSFGRSEILVLWSGSSFRRRSLVPRIHGDSAKLLDKKLAGDEGIKQVSEQGYEEMVGGDKSHKDHILQ